MVPISFVLLLLLLMVMPVTRRRAVAVAVAVAGPATPSSAEQLEGIGNAGRGGRTPVLVVHPHHDGCHGLLVGAHLDSMLVLLALQLLVLLGWSGTLEAAATLMGRICLLPNSPSSPTGGGRRARRRRPCRFCRRRHGNRGVPPTRRSTPGSSNPQIFFSRSNLLLFFSIDGTAAAAAPAETQQARLDLPTYRRGPTD